MLVVGSRELVQLAAPRRGRRARGRPARTSSTTRPSSTSRGSRAPARSAITAGASAPERIVSRARRRARARSAPSTSRSARPRSSRASSSSPRRWRYDMSVPLRQSADASARYLLRAAAASATTSSRCSSSSSRSSSATSRARSAGRSSTRSTSSRSGCRSSRRSPRSRSAGAPMVSIAGGEPLVHPEVHVIARELIKRKKFVYLCTNGILMKKKLDLLRAVAVLRLGRPPRRDARAPRRVRRARGHLRQGGRRDPRGASARGFRVNTNTTFLTTDTPKTVRDVLDFLNDELKVDQMMISPAYAYEKAPDQEHFPGVDAGAQAVQRGVRRRQPQALAAQPHAALPRLPRGQGRLPVHAVGDPELLALRLAAAVLPDGRRVHARPTRS